MNLVRKEERRGPKTWPKGTNCDMHHLTAQPTVAEEPGQEEGSGEVAAPTICPTICTTPGQKYLQKGPTGS